MNRRTAAGILGLAGLGLFGVGYAAASEPAILPARATRALAEPGPVRREIPRPLRRAAHLTERFRAPALTRVPIPKGPLFGLPGDLPLLALTIDDGVSTDVVAAYVKFAKRTGMRLTFFVNGIRPSWTDHAAALKPLIESGQVQIGNHTWSHPDLTKLSTAGIIDELMTNHDFIKKTYGVDARPYFRPPFGARNDAVDAAAASIGYTVPLMWYGSLSDSSPISDVDLVSGATQWFLPRHIVIGHANFPTVTRHFAELVSLVRQRGLTPVTLDDVFVRP